MKDIREVKFNKRLLKFGRKNRFCHALVFPVLAVSFLIYNIISYCAGNGKRFAMLSMTFLLFAVYSSFSFPMFITTEANAGEAHEDSETTQDVSLAEEMQISMEDVEILEDADVAGVEEEAEFTQDVGAVDKYDASEILEAVRSDEDSNDATGGNQDVENKKTDRKTDYTFSKDDWRLLLINKQHSVPDDYSVELGTIETMKGKMQCDERIIEDLLDMLAAAKEDKIHLMICSPYRDYEYQKMLFNRKIERYMNKGMSYMEAYRIASQAVTVPGASEHQLGLALDIVSSTYTNLNAGFGNTKAGKWLEEHSCEYGFILRYPEGKETITGIEYEPWHFRYVGVEAAEVITGEQITLEEFWEEYLDNV